MSGFLFFENRKEEDKIPVYCGNFVMISEMSSYLYFLCMILKSSQKKSNSDFTSFHMKFDRSYDMTDIVDPSRFNKI